MHEEKLLNLAREAGLQRARPLESNFPVCAAFKSDTLRAPTGYDLQLLKEVAHPEVPVTFTSRNARNFTSSLESLYPHAFGRRDLGY